MTGKNRADMFIKRLAIVLSLSVPHAFAQTGSEMRDWNAKDKPGDGVAEVLLPDGNTPMACRLEISVKGGPNCTKVMCKGEQVAMTSSPQSMMAAKKIALQQAKAHYVHFLQEEITSKRVTDAIDAAIKNEGGANAGTQASSGYVSASTIREQASALIKGFSVIEDGFQKLGDGQVAYVIGGVSCLTQRGADNSSAGNRRDNSDAQGPSAQRGGQVTEPDPDQRRRRAGADQM